MVDYTFARKDVLKRTVIIEGNVINTAPLRIGGGKANFSPSSLARDEVLKDVLGNPVIPGSSWKGVFRSTGERILRSRNVKVCSGVGRDYCLNNKRKADYFQRLIKEEKVEEALKTFWDYTCLNCKLFGTMSVIGSVRFLDSVSSSYTLGVRTMVAISREDGAAARRALLTVEFVEPGSVFPFKLIGYNLPNYAIGYLIKIMKNINDEYVQLGGLKTRGFGFVRFENLSFTSQGDNKIGDEDKPVEITHVKEKDFNNFFEQMKKFVEAFESVSIPYPKE
ncbi:CRISPR-associated RAMP protein Csx7 [Acidianus manzaensis]|uniref:CRISPR-associated RAMP protein n=1 Tax=Acidianus manzaensis TaxID=282676 RepID=A0A1W6JWH9_9CREN|nr:CRISPR-associated RAMP protein Csx7 [Acidianus manzaensis]ARM74574.1 CRISPR-associated RAMP protein [Acidianus manzaensis]